jgi:hypothetical protein
MCAVIRQHHLARGARCALPVASPQAIGTGSGIEPTSTSETVRRFIPANGGTLDHPACSGAYGEIALNIPVAVIFL